MISIARPRTVAQKQPQAERQSRQVEEDVSVQEVENQWKRLFTTNSQGLFDGFFVNYGAPYMNDPYLLNQRIKQLKTLPAFLDRETIEHALVNPQNSELDLRTATQSMLYMTYPLYKLQYLYEGILKYHTYITPSYVDKKDMNSPRFKCDWEFIDKWNKQLNAKKNFRRIVGEVMAEGKRAYYLRQSYDKDKNQVDYVFFQDLPSDWYKIIKHSTDSYQVVAFNFAYFWQAGTYLGQFPPIFGQYYQELMNATIETNGMRMIDPNLTPKEAVVEYNSDTMSWYYWRELPADECFMFSFTEADDLQASPFASLLLQAQDLGSYSLLQQQLLSVPLYSMIMGEMPFHDNNKSGSHNDDFRLSPGAVDLFESKVNSRLPPGTSYSMVPTEKNVLHHFEAVPNANEIYDHGLQQMINTSGASTLMTTTPKPSVAQVNAGKIVETRYIDRMYEQFSHAVNVILKKLKEKNVLKFDWEFHIFGDSFSDEKEIDSLEKSITQGHTEHINRYLACRDMSLMDAVTQMDWISSCGIYDKFKQPIPSAIKSGPGSGRPKADLDNLNSDATAASVDGGTNTSDTKDFSLRYCSVCGNPLINKDFYPYCSTECQEEHNEWMEYREDE